MSECSAPLLGNIQYLTLVIFFQCSLPQSQGLSNLHSALLQTFKVFYYPDVCGFRVSYYATYALSKLSVKHMDALTFVCTIILDCSSMTR